MTQTRPADPRTRAVSRGEAPPVNLKERIAALQQRSVSPNTHQSAQATPRGLPSLGSGGLRDKIAKFEEKGGVPVPRGSFAMGAPQLAENAPPKKRGELYGNRVLGLGRPGAPTTGAGSRPGSPLPGSTDDVPGPRKRCISTGAALSSAASPVFSTDEPVPALPNGVVGGTPRRNSLAVSFGPRPGRRVVSSSDAEERVVSSTRSTCLEPDKPPDAQVPIPEADVEAPSEAVEEPKSPSPEAPEVVVPQPSEPAPVVEEPSPADSDDAPVDALAADPPTPDPPAPLSLPFPLHDASQNVSQSLSTAQSSKDGLSEYESAPQSAISQTSSSLPEPTPSVSTPAPADTAPAAPEPEPAPAKSVVSVSTPPPTEKATKKVAVSQGTTRAIPAPNPTEPAPPSVSPPSPPQSKPVFKAVVHRKVTAPPVTRETSTLALPTISTKQRRAVNNISVVEVHPSPGGGGDLAILLEDAALLESRLTEGDGTRRTKTNELLETTPTSATFQPDFRKTSVSTLTEHAPMPSVDSGSLSARSMSIPSIREPLIDDEIPEGEETDGRSLASTTFSQRSPSHRKYLTNIYRLGRRSSGYMPGSYPRDSMSMSSEDSSPVTTPSDNGKRKGFGIGWPSSSPKKGTPSVSRSSSFADKLFHRNRTKSNVSTTDQDCNSLYGSSQPSLTLALPSELSPERHPDGMDITRPASWISPTDTNPEFSPASSPLDKDIFDAFPSVPQTLPPGFYLDAEDAGVGHATVNGRKQVNQRLSMA